jgi:hypothetical protein
MSNCSPQIEFVYQHPRVNELVAKVKPEALRGDLKQELALCLLDYPCDKLLLMATDDKLIPFAMRVLWTMATSSTSGFYYKYKKSDLAKAAEYLYAQIPGSTHCATPAAKLLDHKASGTLYESHEARIFNKYIELESVHKVAEYFGIPFDHVRHVVRAVKAELKKVVRNG